MPLAAFSHHVILSLSKHLRPFGYAQGEWMGQSKDPGARADGVDCSQLHVVLDPVGQALNIVEAGNPGHR